VCFVVHKTTLEQECTILSTLYLISAKNIGSWHSRMGDLQCAFSLDVLIVPSSSIVVITDSERLVGSGFSLGETICLEGL
jgi:hypothetical protein